MPALAGELFATRLTAENVDRYRVGGPDAIAGVGDWVLGNGVVCAAISDLAHESMLTDQGGVLVDLGHCGRNDDQWQVLQPMLNLSREETVDVESVAAATSQEEASITTVGGLHGVRAETVYSVGLAPDSSLLIRTTLERQAKGEAVFLAADVAIHGSGQLTPFTLDTRGDGASLGFRHPLVDVDDFFSGAEAIGRANLHVLLGTRGLEPEIAYGWRLREARIERLGGEVEPLAHISMNDEHFSSLAVYTDTLLWGGEGAPGPAELVQLLWLDLDVGDRVVFVREIRLGQEAVVTAITNDLWAGGAWVRGQVGAPNASLHVYDESGAPLTELEAESSGAFAFRLPPGASGPHRIEVLPRSGGRSEIHFEAPSEVRTVRLPPHPVPPAGQVQLPRGAPMRLTFVGLGDTPNPRLRDDRRGLRVGDREIEGHTESNHYSLAGIPSDARELELQPGRYRVLASRGPTWSVSTWEFELAPGQALPLEIAPPRRLIPQPGWVAADLHVHAAPSDDSGLPLRQRIADFVAMGADVVVSTEHDNVFDYAPTIEAMGLSDQIRSVVGVEVTSTYRGPNTPHTAGHANVFPMPVRPEAYRGGAPTSQNTRLGQIAENVRDLPGPPILQLNHPREVGFDSGLGSFFSHLSVVGGPHDPTLPLDAPPNRTLLEKRTPKSLRDLDFDAVELLNGKSLDLYRMVRADWFAFLLQGEIRTGTANSDSHRATETVALPVSYVAYPNVARGGWDEATFIDSIRKGRLYGSTGPLLHVTLGQQGIGGRFTGARGRLQVRVSAAPWVPVDEVRVFVNGALHTRLPLPSEGAVEVPLAFEADAFVTVEVEGSPGTNSIYTQVAPGYTPFAFTNPIFVDADGDGDWTPPGLPESPPPTLSQPLDSP